MKIDRQKLIEILAERTGESLEETSRQLDELIARIREAAEKGNALEIRGFGLFYFSADGELKFDPADSFRTEINYRYAGMEPVVVHSPADPAEPAKERAGDEDAADDPVTDGASGVDVDKSDPDGKELPAAKVPAEEESDGTPSKKKALSKKEGEAGEKASGDKASDGEKRSSGETSSSGGKEDEVRKEPSGEKEKVLEKDLSGRGKPAESKAAKKKSAGKGGAKRKKFTPSDELRGKNPVSVLIYSIVALLVLVILIIISIDLGAWDGLKNDGADRVASSDRTTPTSLLPEETAAGGISQPEPSAEEQTRTAPPTGESRQAGSVAVSGPAGGLPVSSGRSGGTADSGLPAPYGLYGTPSPVPYPWHTIVLHSVRSERRAEQIRQTLQDEGFRAVIRRVEPEGMGVMWRVGIGQFPDVSSAQRVAESLPAGYRENHFIGIMEP